MSAAASLKTKSATPRPSPNVAKATKATADMPPSASWRGYVRQARKVRSSSLRSHSL
jgi:hypothetical protein